ncbi:MAG: CehA/McbA family metallohydrolase [Clostridia bacterium]|nr:CehA/McbA family metallohydrolase [Clostridia bacterium]
MKFYPMHLHLHCSHEPTASLSSHMSNAAALGIRHFWTTEHDIRMGRRPKDVSEFSFPEKELFVQLENGAKAGFKEEDGNTGTYAFEDGLEGITLRIRADENESESLLFHSKGKRHSAPLFARLCVDLDADMIASAERGARITVSFILSAQPPSYTQAELCYVYGELPTQQENMQFLPFPKKENGVYRFPLTKDASDEIGGVDNALCNIRLTVENGGEMVFRSLVFHRELNFQEVRAEQIKLAKRLGEKWGVVPFVGFEISAAGNHKNCYSTKVPVIDYREYDFQVSNEQAIAHVKKYGGIFSWNHPFTAALKTGSGEETHEEMFDRVAQTLLENRVYGASLMEVGFPFGRDGFAAKEYLRLWDYLSAGGVFITGVGDSDNHHAVAEGWTEMNNFCTVVGLYDDEEPSEQDLVRGLSRGSVWGGNPVKIRDFTFTANGAPQGSIFCGESVEVAFSAKDIRCGGYALCVVNGQPIQRVEISSGAVSGVFTLHNTQKYNFARVEIYDEEGVLIAFSNPIYLVDDKRDVPLETIQSDRKVFE